MQIKEFLNTVCEQIKYKPIRNSISEELENHIEESKENYIRDGLEEKEAEEKAIVQMGNAEEIGKKLNKIHKPKLDWKLLIILIILLGFGFLVAFIRASSIVSDGYDTENVIGRYICALIAGSIFSIFIYFIDYTKIMKYSNIFYIIATLFVVYSFLFGININGLPYIYISPSITFSPVVIAMPLYIIAFVGFLNSEKQYITIFNKNINLKLVKIITLSIISIFIFVSIPSIVSAFILGLIYLIIGTVKLVQTKTNRKRNLLILWGIPIFLGTILSLSVIIETPYIVDRFVAVYNPESQADCYGWIPLNRKIIINSAQTFGEADDTSNALEIFDEGTNYAFISILAHYGWVVSIGIVIAVLALSIELIINSIKIKEINGKLLIIGMSSMFILQSIFNILMNLNLIIDANFNLPFVSYGRLNLIVNMICLALVLAIYRRKDILIRNNIKAEKTDYNL